MVLSRWHVFGMEVYWLTLVGLWKAYVLLSISGSVLKTIYIFNSRLREEHTLVSRLSSNILC